MARPKNKWSIVNIQKFDQWRKQNNVTVVATAKNLGVTTSAYYAWLRKQTVAEPETQTKMKNLMTEQTRIKIKPSAHTEQPRLSTNTQPKPSVMPENSSIPALTASVVTNFLAANSNMQFSPDELILFIADVKQAFIDPDSVASPTQKTSKRSKILKIEERPASLFGLKKQKAPTPKKPK